MATRMITDAEARFLMHAVGGDPLIASYIDNQAAAGYDMRTTLAHLPVCPSCERGALHHENGIVCPTCGYKGPAGHKMRDHINRRMFR
jgi:ribosomal protein L32